MQIIQNRNNFSSSQYQNYDNNNNNNNNNQDSETDELRKGFPSSFWSWVFFRKWYIFKSVKSVTLLYSFLTIFFTFLAVLTGIIYFPLNQYEIPYADFKGCVGDNYNQNRTHLQISKRCQVTFQITKQIKPPIHFLYKLQNAYINHRQYLNSYSKKQLEGNLIDEKTAISSCQPFVYNKDIEKNKSWSGKDLDPDAIANPCGFKAFLFFNDTFKLKKIQKDNSITNITMIQKNIAQSQGKGLNYKSRNPDQQWINPEDSHFILWMESQSLMTKQKIWAKIQQPLKQGKYSAIVQNNYQINNMRILKSIRISQASIIGGKNYIIPIFFSLFAIGSLAFTIIFHRRFWHLQPYQNDKKY